MSLNEKEIALIREETCNDALKIIARIKKKFNFDKLSLGSQKKVIDQIQEGLLDAADFHKTDKSPD